MNKSMNVPSTREKYFLHTLYTICLIHIWYRRELMILNVMKSYKHMGFPLWKDTNYDFSTDNCYADNDVWSNRTNL